MVRNTTIAVISAQDQALRHAVDLKRIGHHASALEVVRMLTTEYPDYDRGWCQLAATLIAIRDFAPALAAAREAIRLNSRYAESHVNAGIAAVGIGNLEAARRYLVRALELDPKNPIASLHLARTLRRLGNTSALGSSIHAIAHAHRDPAHADAIVALTVADLAQLPVHAALPKFHHLLTSAARAMVGGQLHLAYAPLQRILAHPAKRKVHTAAAVLLRRLWTMHGRIHPNG